MSYDEWKHKTNLEFLNKLKVFFYSQRPFSEVQKWLYLSIKRILFIVDCYLFRHNSFSNLAATGGDINNGKKW